MIAFVHPSWSKHYFWPMGALRARPYLDLHRIGLWIHKKWEEETLMYNVKKFLISGQLKNFQLLQV